LKNANKAETERCRRDVSGILLGQLERVVFGSNKNLRETATPRYYREQGGLSGLKRNNIKHAHAATIDKKDVLELAIIQHEQGDLVFGDVLQELDEYEHNDPRWKSEMEALIRSGAPQNELLEFLNRRPVTTSLSARIRWSIARRAGRDFQSPAQLKAQLMQ